MARRFVGMAVLERRAAISSYSSQSWARRRLSLCDCSAAHRLSWKLVLKVENAKLLPHVVACIILAETPEWVAIS